MRRLFCFAIFLMYSNVLAYAASGWKIEGFITELDDKAKTVTVDPGFGNAIKVQVLPFTEIDMEDCGPYGSDMYGTFKDLKVGMPTEVKVFPPNAFVAQDIQDNGLPLAREIEVECGRPRAY